MKIWLPAFTFFISTFVHGQDIDNILQSKWLKTGGNISFTANFYDVAGGDARQLPFFWSVNGQLNCSVKSIQIPLSFQLNQQQFNYNLPFNQLQINNRFGLSPTYKGITLHGGYNSGSFSPYTMNTAYMGGGLDYASPSGKWNFKSFGGQIATGTGTSISNNYLPVYDRFGYGFQMKYLSKRKITLGISHFWDQPNKSIDSMPAPEVNEVYHIALIQPIGNRLVADAEINLSIYSNTAGDMQTDNILWPIQIFNTTDRRIYQMKRTTIRYNGRVFQTNIQYKRIDAGYQSMGAPYLNNDLEDLSIQCNTSIWKHRIQLSSLAGIQRNNLNQALIARSVRNIGSISAHIRLAKEWNWNIQLANYTTTVQKQKLTELDSMQLYQVNGNAGTGINYSKSIKNLGLRFSLNGNKQEAFSMDERTSSLTNAHFNALINFKKHALNVRATCNWFKGTTGNINTMGYGPGLHLVKKVFKKRVNIQWGTTYNLRSAQNQQKIWLHTLNITYHYKKQTLGISGSMLDRNTIGQNIQELRVNINYSVNF